MNYIDFDDEGEIKRVWIESDELCDLLSVSRSSLWRMVKNEKFPPPIRFGRDFLRWRIADVNAYLEQKYQEAHGVQQ